MAQPDMQALQRFAAFVAQTGHTYVFDNDTSVQGVGVLLDVFREMGLDPMRTDDLRKGMLALFRVELIGMPDLERGRFIFAPNHVSDVDALLLGLLHPRIRIVSKDGWTRNEQLRRFLDRHYDLCELDRASLASLRALLRESVQYFADPGANRHYLIFSQGTISDFNRNSPERISNFAHKLSVKTGVAIVNVFVEQVSLDQPTRIVFDRPMTLSPGEDFRAIWLERETALQNALIPPARMPTLSHKHANNNRPGDAFF